MFVPIGETLDDVLASALSHDPDERPSSARELRERLLEAIPDAQTVDPVDRAALLMAVCGDELAIRRVQLDLIDQSALSPDELRTMPKVALQRWTLPSERISFNSLYPPPMSRDPAQSDLDEEITEVELDWTRAEDDPVATH